MSGLLVKRHAHRAVVLTLGLAGLSLHAGAQSWSYCALEDDVCQVRGEGVVRYGTNGQYAYRKANGPVLCSNQHFGDPAPKQAKECAVSYNPKAWREATSAGQHSTYPPSQPSYPSGGGTYPPPSQPSYPSGGGTYPAPIGAGTGDGGEWRTCATEDAFCAFRGSREVRFGAEGRYHVRTAVDGVQCHVHEFGDPIDGVRKHCQVRTHGGNAYKGSYNTYPAPATGHDNRNWRICAEEDGLCNPPRNATVRFGAEGRYAYAERVQGSIPCSIYTFGDPIKGARKVCEYTSGR